MFRFEHVYMERQHVHVIRVHIVSKQCGTRWIRTADTCNTMHRLNRTVTIARPASPMASLAHACMRVTPTSCLLARLLCTCARRKIRRSTNACIHTGMHTHTRMYAHIRTHTYIHAYIHAYTQECTHVRACTHTYTCMHTTHMQIQHGQRATHLPVRHAPL